jgi:hypothetical protein
MYAAVADESAWRSIDLPKGKEDLVVPLSPGQVGALDAALRDWNALGKPLKDMRPGELDLRALQAEVGAWYRVLKDGRGAVILRGFPVQRWTLDDTMAVYVAIGMAFGRPVTQSVLGDLVGHVIDMSREKPDARSYQSSRELVFHSDFCDIMGLLCIRKAVAGGLSRICSGTAIHDELVRASPDLLAPLYRGFRVHRMGEELAGTAPITPYRVPVFSQTDGKLSVLFVKVLCERAADLAREPLSAHEVAALRRMAEIADDRRFMLEFMLEPGEALFVNNLLMLHSRTAVNNPPDAPRRHLLRLWLNNADFRPRVKELDIYESAGGINVDEARKPTYAGTALERAIDGN